MVSHGFYFLFNLSDKAQYLAGLLTGSECCRIVAVASVGIGHFAYWAQDTEAADVEKLLGEHVEAVERVDEVDRAVVVVFEEVLAVEALGGSCSVDDDIPLAY